MPFRASTDPRPTIAIADASTPPPSAAEPLYDVPGSSIRHVLITAPVVLGRSPPLYFSRGEKSEFYSAALEDEERALGLGKAGMGMAVGGKAGGSKGGRMP